MVVFTLIAAYGAVLLFRNRERNRPEKLKVTVLYAHLFRQM
jgi:hypothetical protein